MARRSGRTVRRSSQGTRTVTGTLIDRGISADSVIGPGARPLAHIRLPGDMQVLLVFDWSGQIITAWEIISGQLCNGWICAERLDEIIGRSD